MFVKWEKHKFDFELSKGFNKYGNTKRLLDTTSSLGTFETSPSLKNWKETDDDQYVLKSNKTSNLFVTSKNETTNSRI